MLSVREATDQLLKNCPLMDVEEVALDAAIGRVLGADLCARLTQPPFHASAMDGFAARASDLEQLPTTLRIIGESAAGHPFAGEIAGGEAVRIFTGAPVPTNGDVVIMQENCTYDPREVTVNETSLPATHIRPLGYDFKEGECLIKAGQRLTYRDLALAASMNIDMVPVRRLPRVAVLATGDELKPPGSKLSEGQIVSSIPNGLAPLIEQSGGQPILLGIAEDNLDSLKAYIEQASCADILLTIGGASVGDHDLVQQALVDAGMSLDFWKIAMRPGKPLMVGQLGAQKVIGVPGNPVSAHICSLIFLRPLIKAMLQCSQLQSPRIMAEISCDLGANGPREHYMRAHADYNADGMLSVTPLEDQDSSLVASFASANALLVRPIEAKAVAKGELVSILMLD